MRLDTFLNNARLLLENNMAFYSKKADGGRKLRSKELRRYYKGISRNHRGQAVLEWEVPSSSDPGKNYSCYISIEPPHGSLFVLASAGGKVADKAKLIKDADVRCFCTCPDFNWSGMKYNMKHRYDGYEDGHTSEEGVPDGSDIRPKHRDPRGKNTVCKHLLACFNGILLSAPVIMKSAREAKFPKEYTADKEKPDVLDHEDEKYGTTGEITVMNSGSDENPGSGEINMANTETDRPVVDYPETDEDKAITILGESAPVKIPEAQAALDALADTLGKPEATPGSTSVDDVTAFNSGSTQENSGGESEIQMMNSGENERFNPLTDIEDASKLPMFNPGPSEEDEDEDNLK